MTTNGNGYQVEMKNGKLVITVDVSPAARQKASYSKSGKNKLLATTHGFVSLDDGVLASFNIIAK